MTTKQTKHFIKSILIANGKSGDNTTKYSRLLIRHGMRVWKDGDGVRSKWSTDNVGREFLESRFPTVRQNMLMRARLEEGL